MAASTNIHGFNIGGNNNSFDQRGHFYRAFLSGNVSGMLVKQNSTPNMTVLVEHGSALLNKNTTSASVAEVKSDTSVTIDTANTSNPRIDSIVIYEDTSIAIPTIEANYWQDGAGGRFKIVSLPGTAGAAPVALSDASIQTAIGAGKPWARLADITVLTNSTTILNSNIADKRSQMGGTIPDKAVTAQKIDFATFAGIRNDSSNLSSIVGVKIFSGWGQFIGNGTSTQNVSVSFPAAFTTTPYMVIVKLNGYKSSGTLTTLKDVNNGIGPQFEASTSAISNSGFTANFNGTVNFGAAYHAFSWIAIGI